MQKRSVRTTRDTDWTNTLEPHKRSWQNRAFEFLEDRSIKYFTS